MLKENITIEPYTLSEKESTLLNKTGVEEISFFNITGTLKENLDLQFSIEVYEKGEFKEKLLSTLGEPKEKFKNSFISFGVSRVSDDENHYLKLMAGTPSSLGSTNYIDNMLARSFSMLIKEKVILEKNKPIYLAAWTGTTKNQLHPIESEKGELPKGIEKIELAILYKVLLTDNEND